MNFPPQGAFVVQFATDTDVTACRIVGRVEHIVSHQTAQFESLEGLVKVMTHMLEQMVCLGRE